MRETLVEIYNHLRGAWKYRWYMIVISWAICIPGWYHITKMPDVYQASAKVYVDTSSVLQPLLRGLTIGGSSPGAQAELVTRTLLTRPNIEKLIQMTDLDVTVNSDEEMASLISSIQGRITLDVDRRRANLYQISFTDGSPEAAKKIVQALLTVFVESSLGESRKGGDVAQLFLDEQIAEYEQKLIEAEEKLRDFKQQNVGLMPSEGGYYVRLQQAKDELENSELELKEAEKRRRTAEAQIESARSAAQAPVQQTSSVTSTSVDARLDAMRSRLDDLLLKYTEIHPDVQAVKDSLVVLEKQRSSELKTLNQNKVQQLPPNVEDSHVYQQLQLILADAEINVASLRERVKQYRTRVAHLSDMVNTIPEVEAKFKKLTRNYGIYKKNYDDLVAKRESAQISEDASRSEDEATFKVVEPPYAPTAPMGSQRSLFGFVVLLVGLGVGGAFSFLMTQLKPTFDRHRDLIEVTGYPVLGYVSLMRSNTDLMKKRAEISLFILAVLMLIAAFVAIQSMGMKI